MLRVFSLLVICFTPAFALELDESPAQGGDWGFRPADGSGAAATPPSFTWRPHDDAAQYRLQIAEDDAFETLAYTVETPWSSHVPPEAFASGNYWWRYAAVDTDGAASGWSQTRAFTVPAGADVFPRPALATLVERVPDGHPRLFIRPEEVDRYKGLAEGDLADAFAGILASADKLLANPPDTSEPPKYPEGTVRKSEEWKDIWWGNRRRAVAAADGAATLGFAYMLTDKQEYGEAARDILMEVMAWDPKGSTQYNYNDEAAMPLLYYPARAYTWIHDILSPEERAKVQEVMHVRGKDCFDHLRNRTHLWRPYASHSNRAWHWLGEVGIAFLGDFDDAETWVDYSTLIFHSAYPVWGGTDGGWHEGTAYWRSYLIRFMYWVYASRAALDIDPFEKPFFHQTGYYGMYTLPPGTQAGGLSDQTTGIDSSDIVGLMTYLAAGAKNPHWWWYAEQHRDPTEVLSGYLGFIAQAGAQELEAEAPTDLPDSKLFAGVGLAALNTDLLDGTDNVQIHFKSSPYGRQSHGYNSNNGFLLYLDGHRVFLRTGRRDVYGSPHHTDWMWSSRSDNAILVNGKGQVKHDRNATGAITHFHTSEALDVVVGEAADSFEAGLVDRWTRRILFLKPHAIVIHDVLETPEPSQFDFLLHTPSEMELTDHGMQWEGEPGSVDVRFLTPGGLAFSKSDQYDPPPHEWQNWDLGEWHFSAVTEEDTAQQEFVTLIAINGAEVDHETDGAMHTVQTPDGTATIRLESGSFAVDYAGEKQTLAREE